MYDGERKYAPHTQPRPLFSLATARLPLERLTVKPRAHAEPPGLSSWWLAPCVEAGCPTTAPPAAGTKSETNQTKKKLCVQQPTPAHEHSPPPPLQESDASSSLGSCESDTRVGGLPCARSLARLSVCLSSVSLCLLLSPKQAGALGQHLKGAKSRTRVKGNTSRYFYISCIVY